MLVPLSLKDKDGWDAEDSLIQVTAAPPSPSPKSLGQCAKTKGRTLARSITCALGNKRMFDPCDLAKLTKGGGAHTCNSERPFSSQHYW